VHTVNGDVRFGSMSPKEAEDYNGQIVMNTEEELFYPRLTVGQTMDFAARLKVPFHLSIIETRFRSPPDTPRTNSFPTLVSAVWLIPIDSRRNCLVYPWFGCQYRIGMG
jgi:hypothetical protein